MSFAEELKTTIVVDMVGSDLRVINLPEGWTLDLTLMLARIRADAQREREGWEKRLQALTEPPKQDVKVSMDRFDLHFGDMSFRGLTPETYDWLNKQALEEYSAPVLNYGAGTVF